MSSKAKSIISAINESSQESEASQEDMLAMLANDSDDEIEFDD